MYFQDAGIHQGLENNELRKFVSFLVDTAQENLSQQENTYLDPLKTFLGSPI